MSQYIPSKMAKLYSNSSPLQKYFHPHVTCWENWRIRFFKGHVPKKPQGKSARRPQK
jgi:hypothetical protein